MTTEVLFSIDGTPTPASGCSWFMYAPCGCMSGAHSASYGDTVVASETQAWESYEPLKVTRARMQKQGFTIAIGPRSLCMKLSDNCPHEPKWGLVKTTVPEGHQWAKLGRSGRRKHLVPDAAITNRASRTYDDVPALCKATGWRWSAEWYDVELPECSKCAKAATAIPSTPKDGTPND
jgi:hypothetical protein